MRQQSAIGRYKKWTREEHLLAFNLYCKIPFGSIGERHPEIVELAHLLKRTPGAVSYKLANFARADRELQSRGIRGMPHGAKGELDVWNEFYRDPETLIYQSEQILASRRGLSLHESLIQNVQEPFPRGDDREQVVRVRVGQSFFRSMILAAYDNRCCVTGLSVPGLLVASHIVPWSADPSNRLNPRNGICLNSLHDKAFESGLMGVDSGLRICFCESIRSRDIKRDPTLKWLLSFQGRSIILPKRFLPSPELLKKHRAIHGFE